MKIVQQGLGERALRRKYIYSRSDLPFEQYSALSPAARNQDMELRPTDELFENDDGYLINFDYSLICPRPIPAAPKPETKLKRSEMYQRGLVERALYWKYVDSGSTLSFEQWSASSPAERNRDMGLNPTDQLFEEDDGFFPNFDFAIYSSVADKSVEPEPEIKGVTKITYVPSEPVEEYVLSKEVDEWLTKYGYSTYSPVEETKCTCGAEKLGYKPTDTKAHYDWCNLHDKRTSTARTGLAHW